MLLIDRSKIEVPYKTRWWGQDCICDPRFVEQSLGDGDVLLGLQPLNTRPNYYVIRVDSSWHLSGCRACADQCPDELVEHLDEIYDAIEEEYLEVDSIRYNNEHDLSEEEEAGSDEWPVLDLNCGSSWFVMDHSKYITTDQIHGASS